MHAFSVLQVSATFLVFVIFLLLVKPGKDSTTLTNPFFLTMFFKQQKVLELKKFSNFKLDIDYSFSFLRKLPQWG